MIVVLQHPMQEAAAPRRRWTDGSGNYGQSKWEQAVYFCRSTNKGHSHDAPANEGVEKEIRHGVSIK